MGVPALFGFLSKYNKSSDHFSIIKKTLPNQNQDVHIFLDFNGMIYQCVKPEIMTDDTLIIHLLAYLDNLIHVFDVIQETASSDIIRANNITKLYIGVDGIPPRSKMIQQRQRRFHSIHRKAKTVDIDSKYGSPYDKSSVNMNIDTNMISPGTIFMDKLSKAISKHIEVTQLYRDMTVVFNSSSNPGEAEHKLLQYLRENPTPADTKTVIYGLDGDLIMLALTSQIPSIYLIRETPEYGKYATEHGTSKYLYMDIDSLKNALLMENRQLMNTPNMTETDILRFMDDYVVLMMVLGNDFMPKIPWLSIKQNGHDILLSVYFTIQNGILAGDDKWLYDRLKHAFNLDFLLAIFKSLATQENALIQTLFTDRAKARPYTHHNMTERERQMTIMEFMPLQYIHIESGIQPELPEWRNRYYKICHDMQPCEANKTMICEAYWKTLYWNTEYYLAECPCWNWYYPFSYPPTLEDFAGYLGTLKRNENTVDFPKSAPVDAQTLLLMILPLQSSNLLARSVEKQLCDNPGLMGIYFPKEYGLNIPFHTRYHECTPKIPHLSMVTVTAFMKKCKLSQYEIERNTPQGIKTFIAGRHKPLL